MLRVRQQVGCSDELVYSCGNKGVTIAMLDTGERVIILQTARIYSNPIRKASGWQSAVGAYCKFNRFAVYIVKLAKARKYKGLR